MACGYNEISGRLCYFLWCRRERTCCGDDPGACGWRLWCLKKVKPKTLRREWSWLEDLKSLQRRLRPAGAAEAIAPGRPIRHLGVV